MIMKLKKDLVLRKIAGEYIVVPIGRLSKISPMMQITPSAAWLWEEMKKGEFTEESLIDVAMGHFSEVTREVLERDISGFMRLLDKNYMLENGRPEPMMGNVTVELTEEMAEKIVKDEKE